jgi:putative FmdB family regulatory protein
MPLYEYVCESCGNEVEVLQKISDDPLRDCPACAAPSLKKRVSAAGFRLAGSGWYETDFKKDKKRNLKDDAGGGSSSAGESAASTASGSSGDAVSKPAATAKTAAKTAGSSPASGSAT